MTMLGVNLNEVVEKPRLPAGKPFTWQFISVETKIAQQPNKKTGNKEPYLWCKISPIEPEWNDRELYHSWSLAPGALSADDALISIKKFFASVGFQWNNDGTFSTEDMLTIRFLAPVRYPPDKKFPDLDGPIMKAA